MAPEGAKEAAFTALVINSIGTGLSENSLTDLLVFILARNDLEQLSISDFCNKLNCNF